MAPIIPAGGKKMDWVRDPDQPVQKKAQDMFDDDPQLQAIKNLPNMQDGIAELQDMSSNAEPTSDEVIGDIPPVLEAVPAEAAGGAVEKAVKKVEDAARAVADAAKADAKAAVTEAIENVGKASEVAPVSEKIDEIKPDKEHEESETPADEKKEEKCKDKEEEFIEIDIPGVEGDKDGKVEKEGDEDKEDGKEDEKPAFASAGGMKRIAELTSEEAKELRHYWQDMLGFPKEYVDAMLKKYRA